MLLHHIGCILFSIIALNLPNLSEWVPYMMVVEISTIFYHLKLIMDRSGKKNTWYYNLNGILLWLAFLICRIISLIIILIYILESNIDNISLLVSVITLSLIWGLSLFWFIKMTKIIIYKYKTINKKLE